jgi:hypothetical protein
MTIRLIPLGVEENQFKRASEGWLFTNRQRCLKGFRRAGLD